MATVRQVYQQSSTGSVQLFTLGQGVSGQATGSVQLNAIRQGFQRYWDPNNTSVSGQANQLAGKFKNVNLYTIQGQAQTAPTTGTTAAIPLGLGARQCINLQGSITAPAGQNALQIQARPEVNILVGSSNVLIGGGGAGGNGPISLGAAPGGGAPGSDAIKSFSGNGDFNFYNSGKVFGGGGGGGGGNGTISSTFGGGGGGGGAPFGAKGQKEIVTLVQGQDGQAANSYQAGNGGLGAQQGSIHGGNGGNGGTPGQVGQKGYQQGTTGTGGAGGAAGVPVSTDGIITWFVSGQHN